MALAVLAYEVSQDFPRDERYGLKSQVRRASVSIASNIAEGCSRKSHREFNHYLEIALGSAFEVETQSILAQKLGMITEERLYLFLTQLHSLQKRVNAMISKVKSF